MVDWSHILSVLAGGGLVAAKGAWDRFWQRRDKREDRDLDRDERHRLQLVDSYGAAMSACTDALHACDEFVMFETALQGQLKLRDDANKAGGQVAANPDLVLRSRQAFDECARALTRAQNALCILLVLESEARRNEGIRTLREHLPQAPQQVSGLDAFRLAVARARTELSLFLASLAGELAPDRWHPGAKHRALPSPTEK